AYEFIFGIYVNSDERDLIEKIEENSLFLEHFVNINNGIVTGNDTKYLSSSQDDISCKKALRGKNIKRYSALIPTEFVRYKKEELLRSRDENIFLSDEK